MHLRRICAFWVLISFVGTAVIGPRQAHADALSTLPVPGAMVNLSPAFEPVLMKGIQIHPENPFKFDFILDTGHTKLNASNPQLKEESNKLIKYFLASMTVPEKDLWVNLSPYEKDHIIADNLGQTEMGRDMLAQDYLLKQLTASLIYPEKDLGKKFWDTVYSKAQQMYGNAQIPVDTFNKVWIVADRADMFEQGNIAYIVGAHLKVMLEEDYTALNKRVSANQKTHTAASEVVRNVILPEIEKEVNTGKNFAQLRQMYYSMILASWYKMTLKDSILTQVYGNQSKVGVGVNALNPQEKEAIFQRYLQAYKKGVFNYIKEDINETTKQPMPRKYFSGGVQAFKDGDPSNAIHHKQPWRDGAMTGDAVEVVADGSLATSNNKVQVDAAMKSAPKNFKPMALKVLPSRHKELGMVPGGYGIGEIPIDLSDSETRNQLHELLKWVGRENYSFNEAKLLLVADQTNLYGLGIGLYRGEEKMATTIISLNSDPKFFVSDYGTLMIINTGKPVSIPYGYVVQLTDLQASFNGANKTLTMDPIEPVKALKPNADEAMRITKAQQAEIDAKRERTLSMQTSLKNLRAELAMNRQESLIASRNGDYRAIARLTLRAKEINKSLFEMETLLAVNGISDKSMKVEDDLIDIAMKINDPSVKEAIELDRAMFTEALSGLLSYQNVLHAHFAFMAVLAGAIVKSHYELVKGRKATDIDEKIKYYELFNKDIFHIVGAMGTLVTGLGLGGMAALNVDVAPWLAGLVGITGSMIGGGIMGFETFAKELLQAAKDAKANGNGVNDPKLKSIEYFIGNPARQTFYYSQVPVFLLLSYLAHYRPAPSFWPTDKLHSFIQHLPSAYHLNYIVPMLATGAIGAGVGIGLSVAFANKKPKVKTDAAMRVVLTQGQIQEIINESAPPDVLEVKLEPWSLDTFLISFSYKGPGLFRSHAGNGLAYVFHDSESVPDLISTLKIVFDDSHAKENGVPEKNIELVNAWITRLQHAFKDASVAKNVDLNRVKEIIEGYIRQMSVEYKYKIEVKKSDQKIQVSIIQINRNAPAIFAATIISNFTNLWNYLGNYLPPDYQMFVPISIEDPYVAEFTIAKDEAMNSDSSRPDNKARKALLINMKRELDEIRRQSLYATRQGDFMRVARLTSKAMELNKSISDLENELFFYPSMYLTNEQIKNVLSVFSRHKVNSDIEKSIKDILPDHIKMSGVQKNDDRPDFAIDTYLRLLNGKIMSVHRLNPAGEYTVADMRILGNIARGKNSSYFEVSFEDSSEKWLLFTPQNRDFWFVRISFLADAAMKTEENNLKLKPIDPTAAPGGIDLDRNKMSLNVTKDQAMGGVDVKFDPAMIENIRRNGFEGIEFKIQSLTPISLPFILGQKVESKQAVAV